MKYAIKIILVMVSVFIGHAYAAEEPAHMFEMLLRNNPEVSMNHCELDDHMVCNLAEKLYNNKNLTAMYLGANSFGDQGLKALTDVISSSSLNIKTLNLEHNKITDEGIGHFCASSYATSANSALKYLDVRANPLTDKGRIFLARLACLKPDITILCSWDHTSEFLKNALMVSSSTPIPPSVDTSNASPISKENTTDASVLTVSSIVRLHLIDDAPQCAEPEKTDEEDQG